MPRVHENLSFPTPALHNAVIMQESSVPEHSLNGTEARRNADVVGAATQRETPQISRISRKPVAASQAAAPRGRRQRSAPREQVHSQDPLAREKVSGCDSSWYPHIRIQLDCRGCCRRASQSSSFTPIGHGERPAWKKMHFGVRALTVNTTKNVNLINLFGLFFLISIFGA